MDYFRVPPDFAVGSESDGLSQEEGYFAFGGAVCYGRTRGGPPASRLTPAQVSAKAAAIYVPVYIIATVSPLDDPGSDHATPGAKKQAPASIGTIEDLSRWTGGALYYSSTSASATPALTTGAILGTCGSIRSTSRRS